MDAIILKIKGLLKEKKITYEQFSDMIGKSRPTINNYMKGASKIDVYTIKDIADCLGVSVSYFFDDAANEVNEPVANYKKPKKYIEERLEELEQRMNKLENKL